MRNDDGYGFEAMQTIRHEVADLRPRDSGDDPLLHSCLKCGEPYYPWLRPGIVTFRMAGELVGFICPACLTDNARAWFEHQCDALEEAES